MATFTREQWAAAFLRDLGNFQPHPWILHYVIAWTQVESTDPNHYAACNLLNTTQDGFGCDLLPVWNPIGVKQYPTFEDGVAANAACLVGGPAFFYPVLLDALRNNNGLVLGSQGAPDPHVVAELNTWSGNAGYAATIANLATVGGVRGSEQFPGRRAGEP